LNLLMKEINQFKDLLELCYLNKFFVSFYAKSIHNQQEKIRQKNIYFIIF